MCHFSVLPLVWHFTQLVLSKRPCGVVLSGDTKLNKYCRTFSSTFPSWQSTQRWFLCLLSWDSRAGSLWQESQNFGSWLTFSARHAPATPTTATTATTASNQMAHLLRRFGGGAGALVSFRAGVGGSVGGSLKGQPPAAVFGGQVLDPLDLSAAVGEHAACKPDGRNFAANTTRNAALSPRQVDGHHGFSLAS